MKRIPHIIFVYFCAGFFLLPKSNKAQVINYTFGTVTATYLANATPTVFGELPPGIDDAITNPTAIGFPFQYGCSAKTSIIVSSNGWLTFNTGCVGSDPGNQLAGNATQIANAERPIIAPLWDDLDVDATGNVNVKRTGTTPNRILTIEWNKMRWRLNALGPSISFQVKLYETSNRIDFVYLQEGSALGTPASASAGLTGAANGNYYSLQNLTNVISVNFNSGENTGLNSKPASNQSYSWSPVCPLPVQLIYFEGKREGNKTNFEWVTATEKNNDFFTLEGSDDGINFTELKKIKGAGNSYITKHYHLSEKFENKGLMYFRLKQTDFDNSFVYSKTIALEDKTETITKIFPNPSNGDFNIMTEDAAVLKVFSYTGQLIEEITIESGKTFMFGENYASGIYFARVETTSEVKTIKLIKE